MGSSAEKEQQASRYLLDRIGKKPIQFESASSVWSGAAGQLPNGTWASGVFEVKSDT